MATTNERPNVMLFCADHWGGRLLQCLGEHAVMTPTIDRLASAGTLFTNCYSACPVCIPARRTLMTGMTARSHGDRCFNEKQEMPSAPTLAQTFRDAGYQAYAVGKLHVYPQRDRIGFDDVILNEEGRHHLEGMGADDWELSLAEAGHAGLEYAAGACNNDYNMRSWHLPDHLHQTEWTARNMSRMIHRRDPRKPSFFYCSFAGPHPPMWPLADYMRQYEQLVLDDPVVADWAKDHANAPLGFRQVRSLYNFSEAPEQVVNLARRAFYACITHIDHQIRVVMGTLREEGLLDNTVVAFTADHGDMLGDHNTWGKSVMYEMSNKVPLLLMDTAEGGRVRRGYRDDRLVELRDIMPTLLDLAGIETPPSVEGFSIAHNRDNRRDYLYGEVNEDVRATRMIRDERYKLIWYPFGNFLQLFDIQEDPRETTDLAGSAEHADVRERLTKLLIDELYGSDLQYVKDGELVGTEAPPFEPNDGRWLNAQRGIRFI